MCFKNFKLFRRKYNVKFNLKYNPTIDFYNYLKLIYNKFYFSNSVYVFTIIYLNRISKKNNYETIDEDHTLKTINKKNIHLFFLIGCIISDKYLEDNNVNLKKLSGEVGLTLDEIVKLENEFLRLINWDLYINCNDYIKVFDIIIENNIALNYRFNKGNPNSIYLFDSIYFYISKILLIN